MFRTMEAEFRFSGLLPNCVILTNNFVSLKKKQRNLILVNLSSNDYMRSTQEQLGTWEPHSAFT
jgi:hypothetical protein